LPRYLLWISVSTKSLLSVYKAEGVVWEEIPIMWTITNKEI